MKRFWEHKRLHEMTRAEWESLCDGCGRCCLQKLEDADTGKVAYTNVACRLLDIDRCRCTRYANRLEEVADCIALAPDDVKKLKWLPSTCAYRRVAEGQPLDWWHPLVSNDPSSVHRAGISVRGRAVAARDVHPDDVETHVIRWIKPARGAAKR
jgi:hypothetical protein